MTSRSDRCPIPFSLILLALGAFMTGCMETFDSRSPIRTSAGDRYVSGSEDGSAEGYLVGSFSVNGHHPEHVGGFAEGFFRYSAYALYFENVSEMETQILGDVKYSGSRLRFHKFPADFKLPEGAGLVFVVPLPEGDYRFNRFEFSNPSLFVDTTFYSFDDFEIFFDIKAGEATYVGEIRFNHLWAISILGQAYPDGCYVEAFDEIVRDRSALKGQYPFLEDVPFKISVIREHLLRYHERPTQKEAAD